MREGRVLKMQAPKEFHDIVVYPTQELLGKPRGAFYRGGPDWPRFYSRVLIRHCWFKIPVPVDRRPIRTTAVQNEIDSGIWCGPISFHFGHMIADFGMRIAAAARLSTTLPMVFSFWAQVDAVPPPFFWEIIDWFNISPDRVVIISAPTRFVTLYAFAQAERLYGGNLITRTRRKASQSPGMDGAVWPETVYVSRSKLAKGNFAGEKFLDDLFCRAGIQVIHPETLNLRHQIAVYQHAKHIIFSEGSALHVLQLLESLEAEVTVLVRRRWRRVARSALQSRVRHLRYLRPIRGMVCGLTASGAVQTSAGLTFLDVEAFLAAFDSIGIHLRSYFDREAFHAAQEASVAAWLSARQINAPTAMESDFIGRQLSKLNISQAI